MQTIHIIVCIGGWIVDISGVSYAKQVAVGIVLESGHSSERICLLSKSVERVVLIGGSVSKRINSSGKSATTIGQQ